MNSYPIVFLSGVRSSYQHADALNDKKAIHVPKLPGLLYPKDYISGSMHSVKNTCMEPFIKNDYHISREEE